MNNSPFKKSSLSEMCKQIISAPVIFKMKDNTECLAFYNHEDSLQATKLYILFPDTSIPKYIEGNDLYNLRESIIHGITKTKGMELYTKSGMNTHKESTRMLIEKLINKAPIDYTKLESSKEAQSDFHVVYNKKHACGWVKLAKTTSPTMAIMKDLKDKEASEVIINGTLDYNVTFDTVYWAAGISSKEFTDFKVKLRDIEC